MPAISPAVTVLEAELYLLAGIIRHNAWAIASVYVSPNHFTLPLARAAIQAVIALDQQGAQPSIPAVLEYLHRQQTRLSPDDLTRLIDLEELAILPSQVEYYAKLIHENAARRSYQQLCKDIAARANDPKISVAELLQQHETALGQFAADYYIAADWTQAAQAAQQLLDSLSTNPNPAKVSYHLPSLDINTGGCHPGELVYIAARPGVGKTNFAIHLALKNARNLPTALFTLEMTTQEISGRMLAAMSSINSKDIREGRLDDNQRKFLAKLAKDLENLPLYINDKPRQSISEIRLHLHRLRRTHNIQLAIIDYLQLVRAAIKTYSREQEVAYISATLKATAKELQIPIVCTTQLNRNPEQRRDLKPQLSDLRESGALEQDADQVILLWPSKTNDAINFHLAKNRHGPTHIGVIKINHATCTLS